MFLCSDQKSKYSRMLNYLLSFNLSVNVISYNSRLYLQFCPETFSHTNPRGLKSYSLSSHKSVPKSLIHWRLDSILLTLQSDRSNRFFHVLISTPTSPSPRVTVSLSPEFPITSFALLLHTFIVPILNQTLRTPTPASSRLLRLLVTLPVSFFFRTTISLYLLFWTLQGLFILLSMGFLRLK